MANLLILKLVTSKLDVVQRLSFRRRLTIVRRTCFWHALLRPGSKDILSRCRYQKACLSVA